MLCTGLLLLFTQRKSSWFMPDSWFLSSENYFFARVYPTLLLLLSLKQAIEGDGMNPWLCCLQWTGICYLNLFSSLFQMTWLHPCSWDTWKLIEACVGWHLLYWYLHNYVYLLLREWLGDVGLRRDGSFAAGLWAHLDTMGWRKCRINLAK